MAQTEANGGRTKTLDSKVPQARTSGDVERAPDWDLYQDLVIRTADVIQDWAFWRWLGRRNRSIPWEAYQGITVSANGSILDAGACTVAAAYQRVVANMKPDLSVTPGSMVWWKNLLGFVQAELSTRNVLRAKGGR